MTARRPTTERSQFNVYVQNPGRNFGDNWDVIDPAHLQVWKEATSHLAHRSYQTQNWTATIEADWKPVLRRNTHNAAMTKKMYSGEFEIVFVKSEKRRRFRPVKFTCGVSITTLTKSKPPSPMSAIESFLHDAFLIMNLAAPGSLDLYHANLRSTARERYSPELMLSNTYFDLALIRRYREEWPAADFVPLQATCEWFAAARSSFSQLPQTKMERVLFGLLHISTENLTTPTTIVWLFHSLETLFDTRAGENFRTLISRIELLLTPNDKERRILRKNLRRMYDLRSAFVHGGIEVAHPMHDETLDAGVNDTWTRLSDLTEFGFALLVAALQEIIRRGWREPRFDEVLRGESIAEGRPTVK